MAMTLCFALAYTLVWTLAALILQVAALLAKWAQPASPSLFSFVIAIAWQTSPSKQRFLNRCHHEPSINAFVLAAPLHAACVGLTRAMSCIGTF